MTPRKNLYPSREQFTLKRLISRPSEQIVNDDDDITHQIEKQWQQHTPDSN